METWRQFNPRARAGILRAQSAAQKAGANSITPVHLIAGFASLYGKWPGLIAGRFLRFRRRRDSPKPDSPTDAPPLGLEARRLLSSAVKQACDANEPVDVKHIWSALRHTQVGPRLRTIVRVGSSVEAARGRSVRWLAHLQWRRTARLTWLASLSRDGLRYFRLAGSVLRAGVLLLMISMATVMMRVHRPKVVEVWILSCFAFSLFLLVFIFPALVWIGSRKIGIRSTRLLAIPALIAGTLNIAAYAFARLNGVVVDAEGWLGWLICSVVTALPLTAMLFYFEATHPGRWQPGRRRGLLSRPVPFPAADSETTSVLIRRWQCEGLMPEVERGKVLVWKHVLDREQLHNHSLPMLRWMQQQWNPRAYLGMRLAAYQIGEPYHYEGSMVCAGPYGALHNYVREIGQSGVLLAIVADRTLMAAVPQHHLLGGVFLAPVGTPLAAYQATRVGIDEFEFRLIEGQDALRWLDQPMPGSSKQQSRSGIFKRLSTWWRTRWF